MKAFIDEQLTEMAQPFIFDEDETVESEVEEHGDNTEKEREENNDVIVID